MLKHFATEHGTYLPAATASCEVASASQEAEAVLAQGIALDAECDGDEDGAAKEAGFADPAPDEKEDEVAEDATVRCVSDTEGAAESDGVLKGALFSSSTRARFAFNTDVG